MGSKKNINSISVVFLALVTGITRALTVTGILMYFGPYGHTNIESLMQNPPKLDVQDGL